VINTPVGKGSFEDEGTIRKASVACGVPYMTTLSAANAAVQSIRALQGGQIQVRSLQEWNGSHQRIKERGGNER
jgi:carbamoyl-phosphate synthase large subunit